MAEDTDQTTRDGAAEGRAGAIRLSGEVQGVEAVASPPAPFVESQWDMPPRQNRHGPHMDPSTFPLSPETPLALRLPLPASPEDWVIEANPHFVGRFTSPTLARPIQSSDLPPQSGHWPPELLTAISNGQMSLTPGSAELNLVPSAPEVSVVERRVILERTLSDRPEDIREAARALSKAITDQIELLNTSKPNDPDALARHDDFIAFLRQIVERLDRFAEALDAAAKATSPEKAVWLESAAGIARPVGAFVREGLEKHRSAIQVCAVQVPAIWLSVLGLHWIGVDATTAFCGIAGLMGWKAVSKDVEKK